MGFSHLWKKLQKWYPGISSNLAHIFEKENIYSKYCILWATQVGPPAEVMYSV